MISSAFALKERGRGTKGKSLQSRLVPLRGGGSKKRETIIAFPFFVFLSLRARRFYQLSLSLSPSAQNLRGAPLYDAPVPSEETEGGNNEREVESKRAQRDCIFFDCFSIALFFLYDGGAHLVSTSSSPLFFLSFLPKPLGHALQGAPQKRSAPLGPTSNLTNSN